MPEHRSISSKEIYESFKTIYVLLFGLNVSSLLFTIGIAFQSINKNLSTYRFMFETSIKTFLFIFCSIFVLFIAYCFKVGYRYGVFRHYAQTHKKGFFKLVAVFEHVALAILLISIAYFIVTLRLNYTYAYY